MIHMTGVAWRTSSYTNTNGACVEVADLPAGGRLVRDTKDHGRGPVLLFTSEEWEAFVGAVKHGEFNC